MSNLCLMCASYQLALQVAPYVQMSGVGYGATATATGAMQLGLRHVRDARRWRDKRKVRLGANASERVARAAVVAIRGGNIIPN